MTSDPIAIIGSALATALGTTRDQTWHAVSQGQCGIAPPTEIESPLPPNAGAGQALDLPSDFSPDLPREARYLRWTIHHAIKDANLTDQLPKKSGVILGTTLHGIRAAGQFFRTKSADPLRHFLAGNTIELATRDLNIDGMCATTCSACSSSLGAIALAITMLQSRQLDLVIAGGYDVISEYSYGGFNSLRLVADGPLRPFSKLRQGMKLAEGYGIVILQRLSQAAQHAHKIQAVITGFGESSDAHHLTQPHPEGRGASRAMSAALHSASLQPDQIHLIAAHATATPDNDAGEYAALSSTFCENLPSIPVVAFKSHLGHTLGGAGAVELILSACALRDQQIPPCANSTQADVEFPNLNLSTTAHPAHLENTLNTSLGFGGANTCMILSSSTPSPGTPASGEPRRTGEGRGGGNLELRTQNLELNAPVAITGIGIIFPNAIGNEQFCQLLAAPSQLQQIVPGNIPESTYLHLLNARRIRRMSDYVKVTLAAANLACNHAGVADKSDFLQNCSVLLGTTHGSSNFCTQYYHDIVAQGLPGANPTLFAEGVPNAAAAHLSLMLGIQGACQTIIGTRTAGLDALNLAATRIATGQWDRALVGAAEENCPTVDDAYRHCGLYANENRALPFTAETGFVSAAASVCFVLENVDAARASNRRIHGLIHHSLAAHRPPTRMSDGIATMLHELGQPLPVISSANATWLDRAERAGIDRAWPHTSLKSIYGHIAESFSAGPLAGIAAVLLGAIPLESNRFATLCTDYSGCASAVVVERTK